MQISKLNNVLIEREINKNGFFRKIGNEVYGKPILSGTYFYWLKNDKIPDDAKPAIAKELGVTIEWLFYDQDYNQKREGCKTA